MINARLFLHINNDSYGRGTDGLVGNDMQNSLQPILRVLADVINSDDSYIQSNHKIFDECKALYNGLKFFDKTLLVYDPEYICKNRQRYLDYFGRSNGYSRELYNSHLNKCISHVKNCINDAKNSMNDQQSVLLPGGWVGPGHAMLYEIQFVNDIAKFIIYLSLIHI